MAEIEARRLFQMTEEEYRYARDNYLGYCIWCGEPVGDQEPDARRNECPYCGAKTVYGCEELLQMGRIALV